MSQPGKALGLQRQPSSSGGVQSVARAFQILEGVAAASGEVSLSRLAADTGLPMPTIHRLVRTLVQLGYVRQDSSRLYSLGPRLLRLGEQTATMLGRWARPHMEPLAYELGESINLAVLDNEEVLYVAQVMASRNSMRVFTEVGRRVPAYSTAVGKAMLANLAASRVEAILSRGMVAATEATITDPDQFVAALAQVRREGYAFDDGEQEAGVGCVAVVVPDTLQPMALSVSGPSTRMTDEAVARAVEPLRRGAAAISAEINGKVTAA